MKGRTQSRRAKGIRAAFAVAVVIAAHALNGGSAQAATIDSTPKVLAGFTSQHYPVFFKISADGKTLVSSGIAISLTCASGASLAVPDVFARVPIHPGGMLHAGFSSPTIVTNGTTYQGTDALSARINSKRSRLTGTWQLTVNYAFADGTSDHCASGPVHFKLTSG